VWVCVGEGEIPRMGSPWAWGNIGEFVGVTCGLQRRGKTASELCAVVVRGRGRRRRRLLSLQKREGINLARSLGGFVVLVQAQGLFFFPFLFSLARSSRTLFFFGGETCAKWGIFAIMDAQSSPHAVTS